MVFDLPFLPIYGIMGVLKGRGNPKGNTPRGTGVRVRASRGSNLRASRRNSYDPTRDLGPGYKLAARKLGAAS